jgi:hypothetical protein
MEPSPRPSRRRQSKIAEPITLRDPIPPAHLAIAISAQFAPPMLCAENDDIGPSEKEVHTAEVKLVCEIDRTVGGLITIHVHAQHAALVVVGELTGNPGEGAVSNI